MTTRNLAYDLLNSNLLYSPIDNCKSATEVAHANTQFLQAWPIFRSSFKATLLQIPSSRLRARRNLQACLREGYSKLSTLRTYPQQLACSTHSSSTKSKTPARIQLSKSHD